MQPTPFEQQIADTLEFARRIEAAHAAPAALTVA
jgi:hypothetical protein